MYWEPFNRIKRVETLPFLLGWNIQPSRGSCFLYEVFTDRGRRGGGIILLRRNVQRGGWRSVDVGLGVGTSGPYYIKKEWRSYDKLQGSYWDLRRFFVREKGTERREGWKQGKVQTPWDREGSSRWWRGSKGRGRRRTNIVGVHEIIHSRMFVV